jgi:hypothetical protein
MGADDLLMHWLMPAAYVLVGVLLLFVKVDSDKLRATVHTNPVLALYRFRLFRYGAAAALLS